MMAVVVAEVAAGRPQKGKVAGLDGSRGGCDAVGFRRQGTAPASGEGAQAASAVTRLPWPATIAQARRYFGKATVLDRGFAPAWVAFGHAFAAQDESDQVGGWGARSALGGWRAPGPRGAVWPAQHTPALPAVVLAA